MSNLKKIKNNTAVGKDWVGTHIPAGEYYTLEESEWVSWANEYKRAGSSLKAAVDSGEAVLNDGTSDLSLEESVSYISTSQDAKSVFYKDTLGLSLVENTLQEAIKKVFFRDFLYVSDNTASSTNRDTYLNKATLSGDLIPGKYRISWFYTWRLNSTKRFFQARIRWNDSVDLLEHVEVPKDSGAAIRSNANGFAYIDITENGTNTFEFEFSSSGKDAQAYVYSVALELWRVE